MNKIKLFCFPYAGGSAMVFNKWKQYLHPGIELHPVELAGRGKRIHERPYKNVAAVIDDVFLLIKDEIQHSPYALCGHSMGSRICYELAQRIMNDGLAAPLHIFFSGWGAPHVKRVNEKIFHLMNDNEFKIEVLGLGGTPPEFFQHPELLELFLPLLKNDFRIAEEDQALEEIRPLHCHFTVFLGREDDLNEEECHGWNRHTTGICSMYYFNGGHFFLHQETEQLVRLINNILMGNLFVGSHNLQLIG